MLKVHTVASTAQSAGITHATDSDLPSLSAQRKGKKEGSFYGFGFIPVIRLFAQAVRLEEQEDNASLL